MTNFEYLKSLSVEEFAKEYFNSILSSECYPTCTRFCEQCLDSCDTVCESSIVKWLSKERK